MFACLVQYFHFSLSGKSDSLRNRHIDSMERGRKMHFCASKNYLKQKPYTMVYKRQYLRSMSRLNTTKGPNSHWDWTLLSKVGSDDASGPCMVPRGSVNLRSLRTLTLRLEKWLFCLSYSIKSISSSVDHRLSDFNLGVFPTHIICLQH